MSVGANIRAARRRLGKTAEWLAAEAGCSQSSISQFERDVRTPSVEMLSAIAKALKCRVTDLGTVDYWEFTREDELIEDIFAPWEPNSTISNDERLRFSLTFEKLNSEGRRRVFEFMEDLAEISRYRIDFGENQ